MQIIQGKYNQAKVFTDIVEEKSALQIRELCDQEFAREGNSPFCFLPFSKGRQKVLSECAKLLGSRRKF